MKTALVVNYKQTTIKLSAHEILELAIQIMQKKWDEIPEDYLPNKNFSEHTAFGYLSEQPKTPDEWIKEAKNLKQGLSKDEKSKIEDNLKLYQDTFKKEAYHFYKEKIEELEKETPNPKTQVAWDYYKDKIEGFVKEKIKDSNYKEVIESSKSCLKRINRYLVSLDKYPILNSYLIRNFLYEPEQPEDQREKLEFLDKIAQAHSEIIHEKMYNFFQKEITDFLSLNNKKTYPLEECIQELEKNLAPDKIHDDITLENKAAFYCLLIGETRGGMLNKFGDDRLLKFKEKFNQYYTDSNKKDTLLKDSLLLNAFKRQSAMHYIHDKKRMLHFYKLYNVIYLVRQLEAQSKILSKKSVTSQKESLEFYIAKINEITKTNSSKGMIQSPQDYFSFLKLLVKQGYKLQLKRDELLKIFREHDYTKIKETISCSDFCKFAGKFIDENPSLKIHYEMQETRYYEIGTRVIGIENHADRYAYDYGDLENLKSELFKKLETLKSKEKIVKDNIIAAQASSTLLESEDKIIGFYDDQIKTIFDLDLCKKYETELQNKIKNYKEILFKEMKFYESIESKREFFNIELLSLVEELFAEVEAKLHEEQIERSKDLRTYPDIFRKLPPNISQEASLQAIRELLKGKKDACDRSVVVLTAIWFLSETSRNPLTFITTLMLFDLMIRHYKNNQPKYKWNNVLWHPDTIGTKHPDGTAINIDTGLKGEKRTAKYPQADGWGGKHPMCHVKSWERYFQSDLWPLNNELELVRQKEATLIIRWLYYKLSDEFKGLNPEMESLKSKTKQENIEQKDSRVFFQSYSVPKSDYIDSDLKTEFVSSIIRPLLEERFGSFEPMLKSYVPS